MDKVRIRFWYGAWSTVFVFGLLMTVGVGQAQTQKIRIAYSSPSNTVAAFYVAVSKGFFRDEGIEVELIQVNPRLGAMAVMNGDVTFTTSFVSTFRGILQGLPLKLVFVVLKKGIYSLLVPPEITDVQQLKGQKLGVSTLRGADHLVAEEMLRSLGFDPAHIQAVAIGNTALRAQALTNRLVQVVALSPPHDYIVQKQASFKALAGPPEVGMPASGLFTTGELLTQKPQVMKSTLRGLIKANRFIERNREETIRIMLKWVRQSPEIAARSYELELAAISPNGQMTDRELENLMERLAGKKKPLDEVRDFSFVRQAIKELDGPEKGRQ